MNKKLDLTEGPVFANLLRFSLPLITMNLLQAIYNIADMAIAGHLTNPEGMTAITTSGQITNIILVLIIGFSNGINIITGQFVGAGKEKGIKDIFQTTVPVFGLLAIFISLMIGLFSGPLLRLLNMPSAAFDYAKDYLLICLCGTIFIYLYNTMAAILRGMGNSFYPMLFVVISTVSNIILDYLLMGPMHMGVKGAALATIISQAASLIMIVLYFLKKTDYLKIKGLRFHIQPQIIKMLVKVGLPQACQ
ncbi:MAG: polysaccharide biosynthesis C-terminal domain-containing protein, partial [Lachnospiraceae bacterium]|nr:polysaccharide biosynthesis C-terminal domain-containing protein [Lachnospiraceae bacterium]